MIHVEKVTHIDLKQLTPEPTPAEFPKATASKLASETTVCVDFESLTPGQKISSALKLKNAQFCIFPEGIIVQAVLPDDPQQRLYLGLSGSGYIQICFPKAKRVDLYLVNQGGSHLRVDFLDKGGTPRGNPSFVEPMNVVEHVPYIDKGSVYGIRINVTNTECLIWRLCYLPK